MIEHLSFERAVDEYVGMCRVRDGHNIIPRKRAELLFVELRCPFTFLQQSFCLGGCDFGTSAGSSKDHGADSK